MAKEVSLKITYLQAPGVRGPNVEKLHQDIKEAGLGYIKDNLDFAPPLVLFASGVTSGSLTTEIEKASLDEESKSSLGGVRDRLRLIEGENQKLSEQIKDTYLEQNTQLEIVEYREEPGYVSLKPLPEYTTYQLASVPTAGHLSIDLGPAKGMANMALDKVLDQAKKKAVGAGIKIAGKAAISVATKVGGQAAAQAVTQALGSSVPIIGNIVAFVVTTVVIGSIDRALKAAKKGAKDAEDALGGAAIFLFQTLGILGGIISATFSTMLGIAIIAIISIPIAIALILFIINSGAYIVPPGPELALAITNPYIDISKSANDSEFDNSELPVTVTYTIEIRARRSTLTNIRFQSECRVVQETGNPPCPTITNITVNGQSSSAFPPIPPPILSPVGEAYVITYQQSFSGSFRDSLVNDTFTIIADVPEEQNTEASASAGVRIGNPPDECPYGWPIFPYASEGTLRIVQGPRGLYTHQAVEAIDILASDNHPVIATHTGIAQTGPGGVYGISLRINSSCGGIPFSTVYGHLGDVNVSPGDTVVMGQTIGTSDTTGTSDPHLHYEFSPSTALPMAPPYIPKSVRYQCYYLDPCNVTVP